MKIDLDSLSEEELRALNREIIKRLDFYSFARRKIQLMSLGSVTKLNSIQITVLSLVP